MNFIQHAHTHTQTHVFTLCQTKHTLKTRYMQKHLRTLKSPFCFCVVGNDKHKHTCTNTHTDVFQLETVSVFYCCSDNQNNLVVKLCTDRSYLQEDRNASESLGLLTVTYDWWTGTRTKVRHGRFWDCWDRKTLCRRKLAEMKVRRAVFASPPFWCFLGTLLL